MRALRAKGGHSETDKASTGVRLRPENIASTFGRDCDASAADASVPGHPILVVLLVELAGARLLGVMTAPNAEAQQELELAAEFTSMLGELCSAVSLIAQNEAASQRNQEDWSQAIVHLDVMLSNESLEVQCSGSRALAMLAEKSSVAKALICSSSSIIPKLVSVISGGGLDAIGAMAVVTKDHEGACLQASEAGAISVLVAFIRRSERRTHQRRGAVCGVRNQTLRTVEQPAVGGPSLATTGDANPSADAHAATLSTLPSDPGSPLSQATPIDLPVSSKAQVVATLRNMASGSEANRAAISRERVMPQLVRLMTEKHNADDTHGAAASSAADRIKLAEDTRKLAEAAGQLLYTLIIEGTKDVKDLIIGAISARTILLHASSRLT